MDRQKTQLVKMEGVTKIFRTEDVETHAAFVRISISRLIAATTFPSPSVRLRQVHFAFAARLA